MERKILYFTWVYCVFTVAFTECLLSVYCMLGPEILTKTTNRQQWLKLNLIFLLGVSVQSRSWSVGVCVLCALVFKSYNVRHISNESEQFFKQLAAHNSSQYLTLDFHPVFLSPLPPPFNVDLSCVQDHVELKQTTSRCQHWFLGERGARKN